MVSLLYDGSEVEDVINRLVVRMETCLSSSLEMRILQLIKKSLL